MCRSSITASGKALQAQPNFLAALLTFAISGALAGRVTDARKALSRALKIEPTLSISDLTTISLYRSPEDRSRIREGAKIAGLPE